MAAPTEMAALVDLDEALSLLRDAYEVFSDDEPESEPQTLWQERVETLLARHPDPDLASVEAAHWCVRISGSDDIVAVATYYEGYALAAEINSSGHYSRATVRRWPYGDADHAIALATDNDYRKGTP